MCETPQTANSTIDVFVKRLPVVIGDPEKASNVWFLQGGSGHAPGFLDMPMIRLFEQLAGKVNIYTMDHRGTGRSAHLSCPAAAASSSGLNDMDLSQVPECAQALHETYGDLAAFSTTSAAKDLVSFISDYMNDFSTTVYGVGFGTAWVERLMHFDPPEVTGYVLDGVTTTTGATPDEIMSFSSMSVYFGRIGDTFLELCNKDHVCSLRFRKKGLKTTLEHLLTKFDRNPTSTCAELLKTVKSGQENDPPTFVLCYALRILLMDSSLRTLIPSVVYRFLRYASNDVNVLTQFIRNVNLAIHPDAKVTAFTSVVLENLAMFSKMWGSPTPAASKLRTQFEEAILSHWPSYTQVPLYCASSKEKSPVCNKLKLDNYKGNGIIYERDEYWTTAAKIPDHASVLLMSSEMDAQASNQCAKHLINALGGEDKELITFGYITQGSLVDSGTGKNLCDMMVLASYVRGNGNLDKLDKSCIADENAAFNYQYEFLSTDDAFDGDYDASLSAIVLG